MPLVKENLQSLMQLRSMQQSSHQEDFGYRSIVRIGEIYRRQIKLAKVRRLENSLAKFTNNGIDMLVGIYQSIVNFGMVRLLEQGTGSLQFAD